MIVFNCSLHDPSQLVIVLGSLVLNTPSETTAYRYISKIIVHPNYTHSFEYDLAILILKTAIPANTAGIQPIALARREVWPNTLCQVTGWGTMIYVSFFN